MACAERRARTTGETPLQADAALFVSDRFFSAVPRQIARPLDTAQVPSRATVPPYGDARRSGRQIRYVGRHGLRCSTAMGLDRRTLRDAAAVTLLRPLHGIVAFVSGVVANIPAINSRYTAMTAMTAASGRRQTFVAEAGGPGPGGAATQWITVRNRRTVARRNAVRPTLELRPGVSTLTRV